MGDGTFAATGIAGIIGAFTKGLNEGRAANKKEEAQERLLKIQEDNLKRSQEKGTVIPSFDFQTKVLNNNNIVPEGTPGSFPQAVRMFGGDVKTFYTTPKIDETKALRKKKLEGDIATQEFKAADRAKLPEERHEVKTAAARAEAVRKAEPIGKEQAKFAIFAQRIDDAEGEFQDILSSGFKREDLAVEYADFQKPAAIQSVGLRRQAQAEVNFLTAVLRVNSGAAIGESEFDRGVATYFPRPGDGEKARRAKARARQVVAAGMKAGAGPKALLAMEDQLTKVTGSRKKAKEIARKARLQPAAGFPGRVPLRLDSKEAETTDSLEQMNVLRGAFRPSGS